MKSNGQVDELHKGPPRSIPWLQLFCGVLKGIYNVRRPNVQRVKARLKRRILQLFTRCPVQFLSHLSAKFKSRAQITRDISIISLNTSLTGEANNRERV